MEKLISIIRDHVEEINSSWHSKKIIEFKKLNEGNSIYIPAKFKVEVFDRIANEDEDGNLIGEVEFEDNSYILEKDFISYCNCYLPLDEITDWGNFPVDEFYTEPNRNKSNNIREKVYELIKDLEKFILPSRSSYEVSKTISNIIGLVYDEIERYKSTLELDLLDEIFKIYIDEFVQGINTKFNKELTHNSILNELGDRLQFKLTQDQLLSLIFILNQADVFNDDDYLPVIKFFHSHSTYKHDSGTQVLPSNLVNFQKKYSAIRGSQFRNGNAAPNGLGLIKNKLSQVLRSIN